jgi:hypothetical protein
MAVASQAKVDAVFKVGAGGRTLKGSEYILDVENMVVTNVKEAMLKLGANIVLNLEKYSPNDRGKLNSSYDVFAIKETKTGYRLEISVGADYYDFQDKGVRGVEHDIKNKKTYPNAKGEYYQFENYFMPLKALTELEGWMKRKNMEIEATNLRIEAGDEDVKGRKMLPQISTSAKRLAYYIKKYGIEGKQFIKKSINEATPEFNIDIQSIGADSLTLRISK